MKSFISFFHTKTFLTGTQAQQPERASLSNLTPREGRCRKGSALIAGIIVPSVVYALSLLPAQAQTAKPAPAAKHAAKTTVPAANAPKPAAGVGAISHPAPAAHAGGLQSYQLTLPTSVVKLEMVAVPEGALTVAGKKIPIKPFWIQSTEMPWEAYDLFLSSGAPSPAYDQTNFPVDAIARPSKSYILPDLGWGHHGYPAINISILSATMFCRWLSKETGKKYRLPTENEWEYACRAGSTAAKALPPAQLGKIAWFVDNSDSKTQLIAKKLPNAWKLYDMYGNVGEWATGTDGKPVLCGGTFLDKADKVVPTERKHQTPAWQETDPQLPKSRWWLADGKFVGFRIVCEP